LHKVPHIHILVGIDVDAELARHHRKGLLLLGDADKTLAIVRADIEKDLQSAPYRKEVEDGIRQFVEDVASKRVEIKAHSTKKLHAKLYLFLPHEFCEHKPGAVITGSSNLTAAGLGVENATTNYEFKATVGRELALSSRPGLASSARMSLRLGKPTSVVTNFGSWIFCRRFASRIRSLTEQLTSRRATELGFGFV